MHRDLLCHLPVVLAVARRGGFAAAAATRHEPIRRQPAVRTLEDGLGLPLFVRTIRSVALTEAGRDVISSVGAGRRVMEEAGERIHVARGSVSGLLRLNVPRVALPIAITPVVAELAWRYPDLATEITSDDGLVEIVAAGFDPGVRLGEMIAKDMVAVRLTPPFKAIMVAAPSYLDRKGEPSSIADLGGHNCIGFRLVTTGGIYAWELKDESGNDVLIQVRGTILVSDPAYARDLELAGVGIAYVFEPLVRADINDGRLRWLLPEASIEEPGLFLYFPRGASEAPKLRAFFDTARDVLKLR